LNNMVPYYSFGFDALDGLSSAVRLPYESQFSPHHLIIRSFDDVNVNSRSRRVARVRVQVPLGGTAVRGQRSNPVAGNGENLDGGRGRKTIKRDLRHRGPVDAPRVGVDTYAGKVRRDQGNIRLAGGRNIVIFVDRINRNAVIPWRQVISA